MMSLWNVVKRISGLALPKPYIYTNHKAYCGTGAGNSSQDTEHHHDDDDDVPIQDMANPFQKEQRQCILCKLSITPDYKNTKLLSQFVSMYTGKIYGRHITGLCRKRQEQVEVEIFKAQNAGLMPYYLKDPAFMQDPSLFNPDSPFRNHPY